MFFLRCLMGFFALWVYLPLSNWNRERRRRKQKNRKKIREFIQIPRLESVNWRSVTSRRLVPLWEIAKENGNVRISELAILNALASECPPGQEIFEIGTFDGRTSLNLSLSSSADVRVSTLDLVASNEAQLKLDDGDKHMIDKPLSGSRLWRAKRAGKIAEGSVSQLFGDSASFDFSPWHGKCGLVFIDGSHSKEYVLCDSGNALKMVGTDGIIVWHDYGVWPGVTEGLEDLASSKGLKIQYIKGTSLAILK